MVCPIPIVLAASLLKRADIKEKKRACSLINARIFCTEKRKCFQSGTTLTLRLPYQESLRTSSQPPSRPHRNHSHRGCPGTTCEKRLTWPLRVNLCQVSPLASPSAPFTSCSSRLPEDHLNPCRARYRRKLPGILPGSAALAPHGRGGGSENGLWGKQSRNGRPDSKTFSHLELSRRCPTTVDRGAPAEVRCARAVMWCGGLKTFTSSSASTENVGGRMTELWQFR